MVFSNDATCFRCSRSSCCDTRTEVLEVLPLAAAGFASHRGKLLLGYVDFLIERIKIRFVIAAVINDAAVANFDDGSGHAFQKMTIVAGENDRPLYSTQGFCQRFDGVDIEMVAWFVKDQHVVAPQQQAPRGIAGHVRRRIEPKSDFSTCSPRNSRAPAEIENELRSSRRAGAMFKIFQHGFFLRQAGVNVLGVNSDLAAVAPATSPDRAGSESTTVRRNVVLPCPLSPTIAARIP